MLKFELGAMAYMSEKSIIFAVDILIINNKTRVMNNYETVFILTPVLSEPQMKEAVDKFIGNPEVINVLETGFRRDEAVLRFLTFRQDKFAAEYAVKRRNRKSQSNA